MKSDLNIESPSVCLIVATLGRFLELDRLFDSLARQTYSNFRVIVIDQNPEGYLEEIKKKYDGIFNLQFHRVAFKSVSKARNVGISMILDSDDIISFPDDDCYYFTETLERVVRRFKASRTHVLAGRNVDVNTRQSPEAQACSRLNRFNLFRNGPTYVFFYSRSVIENTGQFDENLGPSTESPYLSGEDTDYSVRAVTWSPFNYRDNSLTIAHPNFSIRSDRDFHKCLGYAIGRRKILIKHQFPNWFVVLNLLFPVIGFFRNFFDAKLRKYFLLQFVGRLKG